MRIEGAGNVSADRTSLDIHLEITNMNESQPSAPGAPAATWPASVHSTEQATGPHNAWYQQDTPSFGVETSKCIYLTALVV